MDTKNLLAKGYFAEELPPPFHTRTLAKNYAAIQVFYNKLAKAEKEKLYETSCSLYSTPKIGIYRRMIGIPNPIHQIPLSELIASQWIRLKTQWTKSSISSSTPTYIKSGDRAIKQISKFSDFKENCIKASFDKLYELKADISKYFPSIYTHSIPWAIHTKKIAKDKRKDKTLLGNQIDAAVRFGQYGQTKGIPIGTDTSRIIAEIIGCALDEELVKSLTIEHIRFKGYRFIDDYQLYFNSRSDADKALKTLQKILNQYSLDLNEQKTIISQAPYKIDNDWSYQLNSCPIRDSDNGVQTHDLITYVNLLISLALQNPNDYVIKYGIKRLLKIEVYQENWSLYESLILKLGISEPSVLPIVCKFLLQNEPYLTPVRIKSFIRSVLEQCIFKGHSFEIAWALWIAKTFNVKITSTHAQAIIDSRDVISIIILLDLLANNLILTKNKLDLTELKSEFTEDGLLSDMWLLVYEVSFKKWIRTTVLSKSPYFKELQRLKVSFYDSTLQIDFDDSNIRPEVISGSGVKKRSPINFESLRKQLGKTVTPTKKKRKKKESDY